VLDECIKKDKFAVAGLNAVTKCKIVSLMGETVVSSPTMGREQINYEDVMRRVCKDVGYDNESKGLDYKSMSVLVNVVP
jgi:S-adenosylmethionine synthetase